MSNTRYRSGKPPSYRISTDLRLFFLVILAALPVFFLLFYLISDSSVSTTAKLVVTSFSLIWILIVAGNARELFIFHLRSLSNLIEAIRTEDYSMRSSRAREPGELAELYQQVNALTLKLKTSRQDEFELQNLLEKVVNQINVAIIACDAEDNIRLLNRLASQLLKVKGEELIGVPLTHTVLAELVGKQQSRVIDFDFPGAQGRWQISQQQYRQQGKPGTILFITDLKQVLSEEEISAWQRLIRVIAHEVNNSLTPISSLCQTLDTLLSRPAEERNEEDIREGLGVIQERARGLKEFISVYARIARLPEPQKITFSVPELMQKIKLFFAAQAVEVSGEIPDISLFGDPVHIEQVLINLIKNAVEASAQSQLPVEVSCMNKKDQFEFLIQDQGSGISNPANLFVPFYTTKSQGAGIGLTLCRQIAARHYGQVTLENRSDVTGAIAKLTLPTTSNQ